jgi:hypothetical protein
LRRSLSRRRLSNWAIWALALAILVGIPLTVSTRQRSLLSASQSTAAKLEFSTKAFTERVQSEDGPEGLLFELRPFGFLPSELTVSAGKYLLLLQNRSGQRALTFRLERENEAPLAESNQARRDWKVQVQLTPGTYILSEANHPKWKSVIRVTPR